MNINKLNKNVLLKIINSDIHLTRKKNNSSAHYCLQSVRKYDYENFICTILLKNPARSNAFAIRSFNIEISRVAEQVTQESIGSMRLKFWADAVEKCLSGDIKVVPKHPVAIELFKAVHNCKLTKRYLNTLVSSRMDYLSKKGFSSLEDMEKYTELTVSNVFYLILEGCGVNNIHSDHAASHLGKAQGIVQFLRSIPVSRHINFLPVPQDILVKNKVSQEEVLRAKQSERLNECIYEVATRAHQHLIKSKSLKERVPREARAALLPSVPISIYLDKLQKVNYDVFHPSLQNRSWKLLPVLWYSNLIKQY